MLIVGKSIIGDIRPNVEGKTFYIPENIFYALPATEKQFTGNLPTGTFVTIPKDLIVGVHWINTNKRVDLDLSVIGASGKIGWDSAYRTGDRTVLFSGDMTDAPKPNGASELFYMKQAQKEPRILMLNYYNFVKGDEIETKIIVAHEKPDYFQKNYMVDINNMLAFATVNITKKQNVLGLIINVGGENRVYFANVSIGCSITARNNEISAHARNYLVRSATNPIDFRKLLESAGANVVSEKPKGDYIDLSPEALTKTTFMDLLNG